MSAWVRSAVGIATGLAALHYISHFGLFGPITRAMYVLVSIICAAAIIAISVVTARRYVIPLWNRYRQQACINADGPITDYRRPQ